MPEDRNLIQGTVEAVIYQNAENGYTVLKLDAGEGGGVTVVGCLPGVAPGEGLSVSGAWVRHASYGEQFKAETVERRMPAGRRPSLTTWPRARCGASARPRPGGWWRPLEERRSPCWRNIRSA